MIAKTITYTDYNDAERKETFYFNLTEAEVTEMELKTTGGLKETITRIIEARDLATLADLFKDLLLRSYGRKSLDGRRFEKSDELSREFSQTEAFSQLYMEMATNTDAAIAFITGILPKSMTKDMTPETVKKAIAESV